MKKIRCLLLLFGVLLQAFVGVFAQSCSKEALHAKYWQYKKSLNKHFIATDRDPSGCINDGIGQSPTDPCICSKNGYGLPATAIVMRENGKDEYSMRDRAWPPETEWFDLRCADDDNDPTTVHFDKKNWLDMGSETPHQMGWHWATLATEYKLLKDAGQNEAAQRALEDLFLGLQAYRRLDIMANCLARERYQEIQDGFETDPGCSIGGIGVSCLCGDKYIDAGTFNFDSPCFGCLYAPNTSGYSGFFLREDATQGLVSVLHDESEEKWNIDVVGGNCFAMSQKPPCETDFSQPCYLVRHRGFMSQDGIFGLMIGLATIKRFIPPTATVTLCNGTQHNPYDMAVQIASGMTNRVDNEFMDRISWPKSDDCCDKEVYLDQIEGGRLFATIHGLKKACSYIDGAERHSGAGEFGAWQGLWYQTHREIRGFAPLPHLIPGLIGTSHLGWLDLGADNANFWLRLKALGWDMGSSGENSLFQEGCREKNQEILRLLNNLLYPEEPNMGIDKQFFKRMLCSAPCGGPCEKREGYPYGKTTWPEFECPNTPNWTGQRWENGYSDIPGNDSQTNGLDFMALHNMFMLYFPEEKGSFFDPEKPEGGAEFAAGKIDGPLLFCPVQTRHYELIDDDLADVQNLVWKVSSNFSLLNTSGLETDVRANSALVPSFIEANFNNVRGLPQFYNGAPVANSFVDDVCEMNYRKTLYTQVPNYSIRTEFDHCNGIYKFFAIGPDIPNLHYEWLLEVYPSGGSSTFLVAHGKEAVNQFGKLPGQTGWMLIRLNVREFGNSSCSQSQSTTVAFYGCSQGQYMVVAPNPSNTYGQVYLNISGNYPIDAGGLDVRFIRSGAGVLQSTQRIYYNGQPLNIANFPPGTYSVQVLLPDNTTLSTNLVITDQ